MRKAYKRGISPVIATVLLIAIVMVLALIIFIWVRGFVKEAYMKTVSGTEKSAEQACQEVNLKLILGGSQLSVINNGNVPLTAISVEKSSEGRTQSEKYDGAVLKGDSAVYELDDVYESVKLIPVIKVQVEDSIVSYDCNNYKKEVTQTE